LNPTSVSSLRISDTLLCPNPEHACATRSGSALVAVQSVASHVKPTSTPLCALCLYSSQTFRQVMLLGGGGIFGGFGDNSGDPDGPGVSGTQPGGWGGNVPPGASAADQTRLLASTHCCEDTVCPS